MKTIFLILILLVLSNQLFKEEQQEQEEVNFDFYHTSEEINDKLEKLEQECTQQIELIQLHKNPDLRVVNLNNKSQNKKKHKAFLLFGEHPREMISSETGLNLVQQLCKNKSDLAKQVNENYQIQIMVNANPNSRKKVENGEYCLRLNENKVDINRNYDSHWEYVNDEIQQTSSGDEPFSELETQTIRDQLKELQPHYFMTVHSGTLGLFTPYGYSEEVPVRNGEQMMNIMTDINSKYCVDCNVGAAGKAVGYLCPGTSLDYAYEELNVEYSFAIEIFEKGVDIRKDLDDQKQNNLQKDFLQQNYNINRERFNVRDFDIQLAQTKAKNDEFILFESDYDRCFKYFNPDNKEEYDFVTQNWSEAIFSSLVQVSNEL